MINNATRRAILRWSHLVLSIPVAGFIYSNPADVQQYAGGARYLFFPAIMLSGLWMWQGFLFALLGVALWLGAFQAAGFGAALLSQIALFSGMKIWLSIRRQRKLSS